MLRKARHVAPPVASHASDAARDGGWGRRLETGRRIGVISGASGGVKRNGNERWREMGGTERNGVVRTE